MNDWLYTVRKSVIIELHVSVMMHTGVVKSGIKFLRFTQPGAKKQIHDKQDES